MSLVKHIVSFVEHLSQRLLTHQTIPEVHLPAAFRLRHGDGGGEVVEEAAAVLRVLGGHEETDIALGSEGFVSYKKERPLRAALVVLGG